MTPLQLESLKKTKQIEKVDIGYRKKALSQSRHFFTKDSMNAPKCMRQMWIKNHNEHYKRVLKDPLYDARCFFSVKERD